MAAVSTICHEEKLDGQIMEQMNEIRQIFRENPGYLKLLGEPAIPQEERMKASR